MKAKKCEICSKDTWKEYVLTWSGGGTRRSPATSSAWLCSDDCAEVYFTNEEEGIKCVRE